MELLTAPATVLLARVYQPVIVLHYRLYWISLDLTDPEHFVSANRPVILDLSVSRSYWLPKYPSAASCGFMTVSGALRTLQIVQRKFHQPICREPVDQLAAG